ncbi:hypothetical protein LZ318_00845, partial [Saccharopolyspora indica]|uniref:hypothetical protein n=1 Tax=Saccharopolyspora indica TaxID=1229659 RepID=UPI002FE6ADAF
ATVPPLLPVPAAVQVETAAGIKVPAVTPVAAVPGAIEVPVHAHETASDRITCRGNVHTQTRLL